MICGTVGKTSSNNDLSLYAGERGTQAGTQQEQWSAIQWSKSMCTRDDNKGHAEDEDEDKPQKQAARCTFIQWIFHRQEKGPLRVEPATLRLDTHHVQNI